MPSRPPASSPTLPARRRLLACTALAAVLPAPAQAARARRAGTSYAGHAAAAAFAEHLAQTRQLPLPWVQRQLDQAQRIEAVRKLVMPPPVGVAKNWAAYRARFIEPQRIAAGAAFWDTHAHWLDQAEQRWGVPPEVVVAIVGVETFYGRITGNFRLLDALATLAFDFPPGRRDRSAFFRSELEEFLVLCARERADPQAVKGSYAGAMGLPQFMPGSVNRFAVDFDQDGHVDLHKSGADVVGSVAHYLAAWGWQRGMATHYDVAVPSDTAERAALLAPDIVPTFSALQFAERGAELAAPGRAHDGLLALVELHNGEREPSYVAGTQNFYAVTRYNWSSYYAMAVIELAQALKRQRGA